MSRPTPDPARENFVLDDIRQIAIIRSAFDRSLSANQSIPGKQMIDSDDASGDIRLADISEQPVSPDTMLSIKKCARMASSVLKIEPRSSTPSVIASNVDTFARQWQKGHRPDPSILSIDDAPLIIGSLWGEAIASRFKWEWAMLTFHEHNNVIAPAVCSPDRALAIYPLHFLLGCFTDPTVEVTILQAYNLLKAGKAGDAKPGSYFNFMDGVYTRRA